jgi:hypothetical protein
VTNSSHSPLEKLRDRVLAATEAALKAGRSVGLLELFEKRTECPYARAQVREQIEPVLASVVNQ